MTGAQPRGAPACSGGPQSRPPAVRAGRPGPGEAVVLAIDHGTSGVKAALVDTTGAVLGHAFQACPTELSPGGGAEQDPELWWQALLDTAGSLMRSGAVPAERVRAVCVSSTWSSTVAVGADGRHLMNALTWMDSRGAPHIQRLMGGFPSVAGYGLANLLRWIPRTGGGPTRSGKDDAAHAVLLREAFPDVWRRTATLLPSKDYLNLRLTGLRAASYDSIALFWVADIRDLSRVRYDDDLIRRLGLRRDMLPELRPATAVLGPVLPEVATELGLSPGTPVVMGAADHQAALVGSGAVQDFAGHLYVGTSSWVQCPVPFKKTDVLHSIASLPSALPNRYQSVNEQDMAGGCLDFLLRTVLGEPPPDDSARSARRYAELDTLAQRAQSGSGGLIFTPWLNGERTPVDDETLRGGLHNLSTTTTREDIVRAVLEGVAYNTRWSLGHVERFIGRPLPSLRFIGGGARSDLWAQIFADVLGKEIQQVAEPRQANARGAAFIGAVGLGLMDFEDVPGRVPVRATYRPNPAHRATYESLFREFVGLYRSQRGMFRRLRGR